MLENLNELISYGEDLKHAKLNGTYTNDLYDMYLTQWLSEIEMFNEEYLKKHPLNRKIFNICFLKKNTALIELLGVLNAIAKKSQEEEQPINKEKASTIEKKGTLMTPLQNKILNEYNIIKSMAEGLHIFEISRADYGKYSQTIDRLVDEKYIVKHFSDNKLLYIKNNTFDYFEEQYRAEIGEPTPKLFSLLNDLELLKNNFISVGGNGMPIAKTIYTNPDFIKWKNSVSYELQKLLPNKVINDCNSILNSFNGWNDVKLFEEIKAKLEIIVENYDEFIESEGITMPNNSSTYDKIFISHRSTDKKYGDAISELLRNLGLKNEQIIYTSHPLHKIPNNQNIYEYLKNNISNKVYCLFIFSDDYFNSPVCLNEMGAFWVMQPDYTSSFVPNFNFSNTNFRNCVIDSDKIGFSYNTTPMSTTSLIEFKNDIVAKFNLSNLDDTTWEYILSKYKEAIV